ncbi:MAG: DUF4192 domain-containing protein [Nocardioides sp.]
MTTTMTARSPVDILAAALVVLGFTPEESAVMLTFGAARPFHARVDLPGPDGLADFLDALLAPARDHQVERVVLLVYTGDREGALAAARALAEAFTGAGIAIVDVIAADGRRWWHPLERGDPAPYDLGAHAFLAQSVLEGRVLHRSRAELAATIAALPTEVEAVAAELARLAPVPESAEHAERVAVLGLLRGATVLDVAQCARVLHALALPSVFRAVLDALNRDAAVAQLERWCELVRAAPDDVLPDAAALLGLVAWLAGSGALSWCALDRCQEKRPDHELAGFVATALQHAVPPSVWEAA